MADHRDVSMTIWGEVKSAEAVRELAETFDDYVKPDWNESYFAGEVHGMEYVVERIEDGKPIEVVREETGMDLSEVAEVCRKHGLSYEILYTGDENEMNMVTLWSPDFEKEHNFESDDVGNPMLSISEITSKIRKNPENALEIVEKIEKSALIGVRRVATAESDVIAKVKAEIDAEVDDAPSVA